MLASPLFSLWLLHESITCGQPFPGSAWLLFCRTINFAILLFWLHRTGFIRLPASLIPKTAQINLFFSIQIYTHVLWSVDEMEG